DFLGAFQVPASAFPFPALPTLSEVSGRIDRPSFPIHREGLLRNHCFEKQIDVIVAFWVGAHLQATV
ncbi:hypothetical protein ACFPN6_14825, partial [Streptomyces fimbriatus]